VKTATRLLTGLVLLAFALLSVRAVPSGWLTPFGLQWQANRPRAGAATRVSPPTKQIAVVRWRIRAKDDVARRVLANDLGLLEAAAWFAYLNDMPAEQPDRYWQEIRGSSDGEKLCRQVIRYARALDRPPGSEELWDRRVLMLEEELKEHLARQGKVCLPSLPSFEE
jgi:hypothetical protein